MPRTKILLTGSSGFVASNLYDALHQDFEMYGLDITKSGEIPEERIFNWDQLDQLPAVDTIIHLAGKAHDTSNTAKEAEYFEVNTGLTKKIFDHFLGSKATRFIFFSSVKAVADTVEGEILTENDTPNPQTPYGQSKLAAEEYIHKRLKEYNSLTPALSGAEGLSLKKVYILRPCMIHDPGNKGNLNLLYQVVQKGIPWPLGAFNNKRSFVSIENLIFVIRQLTSREIPSGIYQIADDEPVATNDLIKIIAQSCGRKAKIISVPKNLIQVMAKAGNLLHLPLNSERLKKLTKSYVVSNDKIKKTLNINTLPVTAKEGLEHTLGYFTLNSKKTEKNESHS